jgi:4-hydroxy-tetrahydrodipicolinate synthase
MARREQPPRFGTVITAMVTPFDEEGAVDLDATVALARWLVDHGTNGLVVTGTTGEGPVLTDQEKAAIWRAVAEAVTVPVIAGTGTNDTPHSIELTRAATEAGVDAVLVVTPYYSRPSQTGLHAHFSAVAAATDLPVVLYDIPVRTGRPIHASTVLRLVTETPNVVAVKDSAGNPAATAQLLCQAPDSFEAYCGDDALILPMLSIGAVGAVSVASHWAGPEIEAMIAAYLKGDVEGARHGNARLIDSWAFESTEEFPNPIPSKAACRALGLSVGHCRPPMGAAPPELDGEAHRIITRLGTSPGSGGPVA